MCTVSAAFRVVFCAATALERAVRLKGNGCAHYGLQGAAACLTYSHPLPPINPTPSAGIVIRQAEGPYHFTGQQLKHIGKLMLRMVRAASTLGAAASEAAACLP